MIASIANFFNIQRQIFGVCGKCSNIFRLSKCQIYSRGKSDSDWLDDIDAENQKLDDIEIKIEEKRRELKEAAAARGRAEANKMLKKIDPVFAPMGLNQEDVYGIFDPIDYVVFDGMNQGEEIKSIIFLDQKKASTEQKNLQRSIEKTIEKENYEWVTLRVTEAGVIEEE